jgi:heme/copper-type cytochrome/quinol oxidase subunit 1
MKQRRPGAEQSVGYATLRFRSQGWFATVDHKELAFGIWLMRIQLSRADSSFLSPEACNQIFTMHGVTMIFWYASPILSGFAVYLCRS